ncbi:MAG: hypothetical protein EOP83_03495 [Verrucomicrobiaceae bacterium]|nr:MAG: hypothetical protein EOP83_03495 [Verrucomicrobiaceae bacterium]
MKPEDCARLEEIRAAMLKNKRDLDALVKTYWWDQFTSEGTHLQQASGCIESGVAYIDRAIHKPTIVLG